MRSKRRPVSPAPERSGVRATRITLPRSVEFHTLIDQLAAMLPTTNQALATAFRAGDIVDESDTPLFADQTYQAGEQVFIHRELMPEAIVPFEMPILFENEAIVAVDKPHFLATTPRGKHVTQTALIRLRNELDLPELSPAHRLDRLTSGVLIFTKQQQFRRAYHEVFTHPDTTKQYEAVAGYRSDLIFPADISNHVVKEHGTLQGFVSAADPPNSHTRIELLSHLDDRGYYRLIPTTGKTHQLRIHLNHLGIGIVQDPLYPTLQPDLSLPAPGHTVVFDSPLQLLAKRLIFTDPFSGEQLTITSRRILSQAQSAGHSPHGDSHLEE